MVTSLLTKQLEFYSISRHSAVFQRKSQRKVFLIHAQAFNYIYCCFSFEFPRRPPAGEHNTSIKFSLFIFHS